MFDKNIAAAAMSIGMTDTSATTADTTNSEIYIKK